MAALVSIAAAPDPEAERFWPQWRGPASTGASAQATPPLEWSESKNIRWKVELPGRGSSSPVVWGDRLFVLSAIPASATGTATHTPRGASRREKHTASWCTPSIALAGKSPGSVRRARRSRTRPRTPTTAPGLRARPRPMGSMCSRSSNPLDSSPSTLMARLSGRRTWATSRCATSSAKVSTPALHGNHLVVVWDHQGTSFIVALDKRTGAELWRVERKEIDTWSTPLVLEHEGRAQVIPTA